MNNQWFFSNNGEVNGPLSLADAKKYLTKNNNVYGWHPAYVQWQPVHCISDFNDVVSVEKIVDEQKNSFSDEFLMKKKKVAKKLSIVKKRLALTQNLLREFEQGISKYKNLTINFNDEVKSTINSIDQHYNSLHKKIAHITSAADIAELEVSKVVNEYYQQSETPYTLLENTSEERIASTQINDAEKPTTVNKPIAVDVVTQPVKKDNLLPSTKSSIERHYANKNKEQLALAQNPKNIDDVNAIQAAAKPYNKEITREKNNSSADKKEIKTILLSTKGTGLSLAKKSGRKGLIGMSNLLKSVFKAEENQQAVALLSDQLKSSSVSSMNDLINADNRTERTENISSIDSAFDESDKKKRRRRRR